MEYADAVLGFYDSGRGPLKGPYGGFAQAVPDGHLIGQLTEVPLDFALGPEGTGGVDSFLSLPQGSYVDIGWTGGRGFVDGDGNDIRINETGTTGDRALVLVSQDGHNFVQLGIAQSGVISEFDLASIGLSSALVVRIIGLDLFGESPGYDVVNVMGNVGSVTPPDPVDPVAATDYFSGRADKRITGNLLADNGAGADSDKQGKPLSATAGSFETEQGGQVTIAANGDFTYRPPAGYDGPDSFSYQITDQQSKTAAGSVFITLTSCPDTETQLTSIADNWNGTGCADSIFGGGGLDTIYGWASDDLLTGGSLKDQLFGGEGNDTIIGMAGNDELSGDAGDDVFHGQNNTLLGDILEGGEGNDSVVNTVNGDLTLGDSVALWAGVERLDAGGHAISVFDVQSIDLSALKLIGVTSINGNSFAQSITGSQGADTISGRGGLDTLQGLGGADSIGGGSSNDMIDGGAGNDTLVGLAGGDQLNGGVGLDRFLGQLSEFLNDTLTGGDGVDRAINTGSGDLTLGNAVALWTGVEVLDLGGHSIAVFDRQSIDLSALTLTGVVSIYGNSFGQSITGSQAADTITGNGGLDTLRGLGGNDSITGSSSKDVIDGGVGNDTITGASAGDDLTGGAGNDLFLGQGSDFLGDTLSGGIGNDTVTNTGSGDLTVGDSVALWTGIEVLDLDGHNIAVSGQQSVNLSALTLVDVTSINGNSFGQSITGSQGADTIEGRGGLDTLRGLGGNDSITGGNSKDVIDGGAGNDTITGFGVGDNLIGGIGDDRFQGQLSEFLGATLSGGVGTDRVVNTGSGALTLGDSTALWTGIEVLDAAGRAIQVQSQQDLDLSGLSLANCTGISGTSLVEAIIGSKTSDLVQAAGGADTITGGGGSDTLSGGTGNDLFVFASGSGADRITDFQAGPGAGDVLDFTAFATTLAGLNIVSANGGADTRITVAATGETVLLAGVVFGTLDTASDLLL